MGWRVKVGDVEWSEEQVTVADAADICQLAGGGWEMLNPLTGPAAAAAIVTLLRARHGEDVAIVAKEVQAMPAGDLLGFFMLEG